MASGNLATVQINVDTLKKIKTIEELSASKYGILTEKKSKRIRRQIETDMIL